MAKQKRTVIFSGTVQGVGFRYTACRIASLYKVAGYVKNLDSGDVECVVEGEAEEIQAFIGEVKHRFRENIRNADEQVSPFSGQFQSFDVEF